MKQVLTLALLVLFVASCTSNYSEGYRAGTLTKFSKKGLIYKTYEGEMNLGGLRPKKDDKGNVSMVANVWQFSLDAERHRGENIEALADSLNLALEQGFRVRLHYNQEAFTDLNNSRGSEDYYVNKVEILRD